MEIFYTNHKFKEVGEVQNINTIFDLMDIYTNPSATCHQVFIISFCDSFIAKKT